MRNLKSPSRLPHVTTPSFSRSLVNIGIGTGPLQYWRQLYFANCPLLTLCYLLTLQRSSLAPEVQSPRGLSLLTFRHR